MRGTIGFLLIAALLPGCTSLERLEPSLVRPSEVFRAQSPSDETSDAGLSEESRELQDVPPPFLFSGLRRWMQEDDPDGSEDGEDYENRASPRSDPKIDIRHPDPDLANFPNSAFTIPQGRVYIENAPVSFYGESALAPKLYNWEFLFRYGVTDRLEFRIFSNGLAAQYSKVGSRKSPIGAFDSATSVGFAPIAWDFKVHFWDEHKKYFVPAVGMEVYIETNMGSPAFSQGTQPSINLLFDQSLPWEFELEWNIGVAGNLTSRDAIYYNLALQWALQHQFLSENLLIFTHGYLNNAALPRLAQDVPGGSNILVMGAGAQYALTDRVSIFGSYNWGLNTDSPQYICQLGFAFAL